LIDNQQYRLFAEELLLYYDSLYDRHIANSGGTGSGEGSRNGKIVDIEVNSD
jgi:hypothetical protein